MRGKKEKEENNYELIEILLFPFFSFFSKNP
jgi:hypothetical protein